jgi:UDP-N-acetylmuramate dehydrogenase
MRIERNISLAEYTYYRIGGKASIGYFPSSAEETLQIIRQLASSETRYFVLGGGTNVLVGDGFWDGAVVFTSDMNTIRISDDSLTCGAGLPASKVAEIALENSKTGLEFLYLLPGSIGGALAGNARYDSISMSDVLIRTTAVHPDHGVKSFDKKDISFEYKKTGVIGDGWIICGLECAWKYGNPDNSRAYMERIEISRNTGHQFDFPSCGCIFKNNHPMNIQVGKLLDKMGMKGTRIGDAEISPYHANFIINRGDATASDVLALIEKIEKIVYDEKGITLEREVRLMGNFE